MSLQVLRQHLAPLPLSASFKEQLGSEVELQTYLFYLELPPLLAPLFPGVSASQLDELTVNNYLYFRFVLTADQLLGQEGGPTRQQLIDCLTLHEYAVRALSRLFAPQQDFWQYYHRCQCRYAEAQHLQRKCTEQQAWDEEQVEEVAAGKAAICYAIVHALATLNQQGCSMQPLLECLGGIHLAHQYQDEQQPYSFSSPGHEHFLRSLALAQELGLLELRDYLQRQLLHHDGQQQRDVA